VRRNTLFSLCLVAGTVGFTLFAGQRSSVADTLTHGAAQVEFWVPDGWDQKIHGDLLRVTEPGGGAEIIFDLPKAKNLRGAKAEIRRSLQGSFRSFVFDEQEIRHKVHGLRGLTLEGAGVDEGGDIVEIRVMFLETPSRRVLVAISYVGKRHASKFDRVVTRVFDSVKPLEE